jgi:membrane protein YdbS with pleckstrin-like domain
MSEWFVNKHGQQHGPYSEEAFMDLARHGKLSPKDMVWSEELPEWVTADSLAGIEWPNYRKDFIPEQKAATTSGMTSPQMRTQANLNPRVAMGEIPKRVRDVLWDDEVPIYAARPAQSALVLSMILSGILWGIIGLSIFYVGILLTLPLGLVITYYSWKNRYYRLTSERTIVAQGIFNVAIQILFNRHIQMVSINTGIIDRWIGFNTIEVSTASHGGVGGILASFPGLARGGVQMKSVNVKDVIGCYEVLRKRN